MKTDKHYISEIDIKLTEFDRTHKKTPSQQAEIDKHQNIFERRDFPAPLKIEDDSLF